MHTFRSIYEDVVLLLIPTAIMRTAKQMTVIKQTANQITIMPKQTANPSKIVHADVRDLNGSTFHLGQPTPSLRRTASGSLFLPADPPVPAPRSPIPTSPRETHALDTVRALIPPMHPFPYDQDKTKNATVHNSNITVLPPPKPGMGRKSVARGGMLKRRGRMHVQTRRVHPRRDVGDVGCVIEVDDDKVDVSELDVQDSFALESFGRPVSAGALPRRGVLRDREELHFWAEMDGDGVDRVDG
jgi:hypothetical protein